MEAVLVRYTTRDAKAAAENERLIRDVFDELRRRAPDGVRYATFKLPDAVSFVHFAMIETVDGGNPITSLDAFKRFQAGIGERVSAPPDAPDLVALDSYGF